MPFSSTDVRQLARHVTAAGGQLPANLASIAETLTALARVDTKPSADPLAALAERAANGPVKPADLAKAVQAHGDTRAQAERDQQARREAAVKLTKRFRRELADGGADAILDSLRPAFDENATAVRVFNERIGAHATADEVLHRDDVAELAPLWRAINGHVHALDAIGAVCDLFGRKEYGLLDMSAAPAIYLSMSGVTARVVMTADASIDAANEVWRTNGPGRRSAWFTIAARAKLHTIAEAQRKIDEHRTAAFEAADAQRHVYSQVDGELVKDSQPNPYTQPEPAEVSA